MDKLGVVVHNSFPSENMMAMDLNLLEKAEQLGYPILRLYTWSTPTISLGRLQKREDILNLERVTQEGLCVVNRPTGGRAVLHKGDFTYSLSIPLSCGELFGKTVSETYCRISKALVLAMQKLGVTVEFASKELTREQLRSEVKLSCFLTSTPNEILFGGRKLIGSAQYRSAQGVLQHGSMPLTEDFYRISSFEKCGEGEQYIREQHLRTGAVSLCEVVQKIPTFDVLAEAFICAFEETFQLKSELISY